MSMTFRPRVWTSMGAALVLGAGALAGCSGEAGQTADGGHADTASHAAGGEGEGEGEGAAPAAPAAAPAGEGEGGEAGAVDAYAAVPAGSRTALRLAQVKGFFLAAQAAAPLEGPEAAAALIGQGLLEAYDPAAAELKATGVDEAALRAAAASGDPAAIKKAIAALDAAAKKAGGDPAAVAKGMTTIAAGLYQHVLVDGAVDPVEYQHSYGAALAAKAVVDSDPKLASARDEAAALVKLWPSPVAPEDAAKAPATAKVLAQASRVELALSGA